MRLAEVVKRNKTKGETSKERNCNAVKLHILSSQTKIKAKKRKNAAGYSF